MLEDDGAVHEPISQEPGTGFDVGPQGAEPSFFTVVVWRDQSVVEVAAEELGPSLRWATATTTRTTRTQDR